MSITTFSPPRRAVTLAATLAMFAAANALFAGPLTPPVGPVASTAKPLAEVEPRIAINLTNTPGDADSLFRISQPGSYYLTGNITGVAAKHGIQISASGVTLDLGGFELRGVSGSLDGINVSTSDGLNITIKDGSLRSWGDCGLEGEYNGGHPPACVLINVIASNNIRDGIALWSSNRLESCSAYENTGNGISVVGNSVIVDCLATGSRLDGFSTNSGCTLTNCIATSSGQRGFYGFAGCVYTNCSASNNSSGYSSTASTYTGCAAYTNLANGFDLFPGCTLNSCNAYRNGGIGISGSSGATITGCSSVENTGIGINATSGTGVLDCNVKDNVGIGIQVSSNCNVKNNIVVNNGGSTVTYSNIRAGSTDNRIEGNNCTDAPIGIDIVGTGNIIVRNTCSGNTTAWIIAASNYYGPIIDRTGVVTAGVNGSAAASTLGSTDSNANFTY